MSDALQRTDAGRGPRAPGSHLIFQLTERDIAPCDASRAIASCGRSMSQSFDAPHKKVLGCGLSSSTTPAISTAHGRSLNITSAVAAACQ